MKKTTVPCARCGRTILPYRSVLPSNEAMDVCGACAGAVWAEEVAGLRAELRGLSDHVRTLQEQDERNLAELDELRSAVSDYEEFVKTYHPLVKRLWGEQ